MNSAQKVAVIVGVGFAALVLAQAVFRNGTVPMFASEWNKTAQGKDTAEGDDAKMRRFGDAIGLDWAAVTQVIYDDAQGVFKDGARMSGDKLNPGVFANAGDLSGRPYTIIDDELFVLSGR